MNAQPRIDTDELNRRIDILQLVGREVEMKRRGPHEYAGPCPFCGDGRDRFVVRPDDRLWLCRYCHPKFGDGIDFAMQLHRLPFLDVARMYLGEGAKAIDPAVSAEREERRQAQAQQAASDRAAKLRAYTTAELWAELHRRMADEQRAQWRAWGVPNEWQDYLELGYTPEKIYKSDEAEHRSPAYTIPYFHHSNTPQTKEYATMQYRLVNPAHPNDRYRFEYGLPATYYETEPTRPLADVVIICEGAKKAMVMRISGGASQAAGVIAIPSKSTWAGAVEAVKDCGRVFIVLDPDAAENARKGALAIGKAARVVTLHGKVDDLILRHGMGAADFRQAFRWAERVV